MKQTKTNQPSIITNPIVKEIGKREGMLSLKEIMLMEEAIEKAQFQTKQETLKQVQDIINITLQFDEKELITNAKLFAEKKIEEIKNIKGIELVDNDVLDIFKTLLRDFAVKMPELEIEVVAKIKQELKKQLEKKIRELARMN